MKIFKKFIIMCIAATFLFSAFSCGNQNESESSSSPSGYDENFVLEIDKNSATIEVGEQTTITANTDEVVWESENNTVAVVTDGVVTGVSVGNTVITATYKEQERTCAVTVVEAELDYTDFPVLAFSCKASSIMKGYSFSLDACVKLGGEVVDLESAITFESSNPSAISVGQNGVVTGVGVGVSTVTATVNYGGEILKETLQIEVEEEIRFVKYKNVVDMIAINAGTTYAVETEFSSFTESYDTSELTWESSNPSIASVANGTVTGVNFGSAVIFTKYNGTVLNSFTVEVRRTRFDFENVNDLAYISTYKTWPFDAELSIVNYAEETTAYANGTITAAKPTNFSFSACPDGGNNALKVSNWSTYHTPCVKFTFGWEIPAGTQMKIRVALYLGDANFSAANGWVPFFIGTEGNMVCYDYGMSPSYISWFQNYTATGGFYWETFTYTTTKASDHIVIGPNGGNGNSKFSTATLNTLAMYFDNIEIC